jgi:predicted nucleic acid-binding protein
VILADSNIWIDHLNHGEPAIPALLAADEMLMHPFVIGELALGMLRNRDRVLRELGQLRFAVPADDNEVINLIVSKGLPGSGIGYVDAHLLASCLLTTRTYLWTRDRRLAVVAGRLGIDATAA